MHSYDYDRLRDAEALVAEAKCMFNTESRGALFQILIYELMKAHTRITELENRIARGARELAR